MNLLYRRNIMYSNRGWLYQPTKQAIVGAFGADGWAVIKATNAYLNQLAASDRDKATALAGFINATPLIAPYICGYIEPDEDYPYASNITFATGLNSKNTYSIKVISKCMGFVSGTTVKNMFTAGTWAASNGFYISTHAEGLRAVWYQTIQYIYGGLTAASVGKTYTVEANQTTLILSHNGSQIGSLSGYSWYGNPMIVKTDEGGWWWKTFQLYNNRTEIHRYMALTDGKVWDYITEAFYLPDGTPWTPSTP